MRFLLGLLVGYCIRGKQQPLITILAITTLIVFVVLPAIALTGLAISVQHRRHSRPAQTRVPAIEGLKYETAAATLRASNLKLQVLATRSDLGLEPGVIVNQVPQSGQQVDLEYIVSVTVSATDLQGPNPVTLALHLGRPFLQYGINLRQCDREFAPMPSRHGSLLQIDGLTFG
jgi:hypothetical protein